MCLRQAPSPVFLGAGGVGEAAFKSVGPRVRICTLKLGHIIFIRRGGGVMIFRLCLC